LKQGDGLERSRALPLGTRPETSLPYGPLMARLLRPLQRAFLVVNRGFMAPMLRAGLGWMIGSPLTGHIMVLRTRGRRSGLIREAPLGYVIRDGVVYCVAGYGSTTPWFLNVTTDPAVEVVLPTRRFRGLAAPVDDPSGWLAAYRALIASFGLVGRAVIGDVGRMGDAELLARHRTLPLVGIRPVEAEPPLVAGAFDPGGRGWLLSYGLWLAAMVFVLRAVARRFGGRRTARYGRLPGLAPLRPARDAGPFR
jgi:deazaflavin-dependent oxidoreductase (nitroreductase family)